MGMESGVLRKNGLFFWSFPPFLAVFAHGVVFLHVFWRFLGFSWCNLVQPPILVPRKHCFLFFWHLLSLQLLWQSVFCFFLFFPVLAPFVPMG